MANRIEYQTVILAALLHDIGKFMHRGRNLPFPIRGTHAEVSGQFVSAFSDCFKKITDVELLETLVVHHHQEKIKEITNDHTRQLAYLINKADILSSRERGESTIGQSQYYSTPLTSVFQRVFSSPDPGLLLQYHPFSLDKPDALSEKSIFPDNFQKYATNELEKTIQAWGDKAKDILNNAGKDFDTMTSHILSLLHSYTLAIPANTQEPVPDISLYDHMKTTAAIAACLYQVYEAYDSWKLAQKADEAPLFHLLVGDVSGIQRYVFDIAGKDRSGGGTARRLRARSLFVQMVSEVAPLQILERFDLPLTNILMASGGKFYLLLPALPDTETRLEEYRQVADIWFLENFRAALGLNLTWVSCGESDLSQGFGETVKRAMAELDVRKEQGFRASVITNGKWNSTSFIRPPFEKNQRACPSCGKFGAPEDDICQQCKDDLEWGKTLPEENIVATISLSGKGNGRELLGAKVNIGIPVILGTETSLALHINNTDTRELIRYPASFRYLAKHVPNLDFKEIAQKSHGRKYLAFLKADVDNLGGIFAFGLRGKEERWDTPSRIATMSRQLDLFFTGWIEHLLETEFVNCYCVFSGGDDLFIIGPWNEIIDFVSRLQADFTRYTCHNSHITLSAGAVIENHSYPVGQAAREAADAVEESKNKGRNRLTLLGYTLTWGEWAEIKKLWEDLREEKTSSAFLYSLLDYADMWQDYSQWVKSGGKEGNVLGLRFQPLLAYNLRRNLSRQNNEKIYRWAEKLLEWRPNSGNQEIERTLANLGLIAQLLILWKGG